MDTDRLRLGLAFIFKESKLNKNSKLQLINFIEHAADHQLKALAIDGAIVPAEQLTEEICNIVDVRFEDSSHIHSMVDVASLQGMSELVGTKIYK